MKHTTLKIYYHKDLSKLNLGVVEHLIGKKELTSDEKRRLNRFYYHPQGLRLCFKCSKVKTASNSNFYIKRHYHSPKKSQVGLSALCKSCDKIRAQKFKIKQRQDPMLYCKHLIRALKHRAKDKCVDFNLTIDSLYSQLQFQKSRCFYSGQKLNFKVVNELRTHPHRLMPSIDRLDPKKGYIIGNIAWCCYYINRMKNDLEHEEFLKLCKKIIQYTGPE